jgi:transcriptional regulator of heat shock response
MKKEHKPIFPRFETIEEAVNKRIYQMKMRGHPEPIILQMIYDMIHQTQDCIDLEKEKVDIICKEIYDRITRKPTLEDIHIILWDQLTSIQKMEELADEYMEEGIQVKVALVKEKRNTINSMMDLVQDKANKEERSISDIINILKRKED